MGLLTRLDSAGVGDNQAPGSLVSYQFRQTELPERPEGLCTAQEMNAAIKEAVAHGGIPVITISGGVRCYQLEEILPTASNAHYNMAAACVSADPVAFQVNPECYVPKPVAENMASLITKARRGVNNDVVYRMLRSERISRTVRRFAVNMGEIMSPTLETLFDGIECRNTPVIVMHYELLDFFARKGFPIVAAITDRNYVHAGYLRHAYDRNLHFACMGQETVQPLPSQVIEDQRYNVVGSFLPPFVAAYRRSVLAKMESEGSSSVATGEFPNAGILSDYLLCTGGLGTNRSEIVAILKHLLPFAHDNGKRVAVFAGTNLDFADELRRIFPAYFPMGVWSDTELPQSYILAGPTQEAITPRLWEALLGAKIIYTKPSGDIQEAAMAAGIPTVLLGPNQVHEVRQARWALSRGLAVNVDRSNPIRQVNVLEDGRAMDLRRNCLTAELKVDGAKGIVDYAKTLKR